MLQRGRIHGRGSLPPFVANLTKSLPAEGGGTRRRDEGRARNVPVVRCSLIGRGNREEQAPPLPGLRVNSLAF